VNPLLKAIYAKAAATPAIVAAFPGWTDTSTATTVTYPVGVYGDVAPERAPLPYVVTTVIAAPSTMRYGGESFSQPSIQFSAYGVGRDDLFTLLKVLTDALDELTLTLATGHQTNTYREGQPIPVLQPDKDEQGRNVWAWVVTYTFSVTPA
jgi:hypothetical protein